MDPALADTVNATFQGVAALLVWHHVWMLRKDKAVAGISIPATCMMLLWSFWNMYYYPSLGQWWSFSTSIIMLGANAVRVFLLFKYKDNEVHYG